MGIITPRTGGVRVAGENITGMQPHEIANRAIQLVPDTRRIVKTITVEENLKLAAFTAKSPWTLKRIYRAFPRTGATQEFMGRALSGGEQQMLAIARALIRDARVAAAGRTVRGARTDDRARSDRDDQAPGRRRAHDRDRRAERPRCVAPRAAAPTFSTAVTSCWKRRRRNSRRSPTSCISTWACEKLRERVVSQIGAILQYS